MPTRIATTDPDFLGVATVLSKCPAAQAFLQVSSEAAALGRIYFFNLDDEAPGGIPANYILVYRRDDWVRQIRSLNGAYETVPGVALLFDAIREGASQDDIQNALNWMDNSVRAVMAEVEVLAMDPLWVMQSYKLEAEYPLTMAQDAASMRVAHSVHINGSVRA